MRTECQRKEQEFMQIQAKMKTVDQIMIEGDDVEIGSDSDVSDTSQISFSYFHITSIHLPFILCTSGVITGTK